MDLISVIVPVYKVEKQINRCIESIVNQSYGNLEIVLVDDGSPDDCPRICDEWAQKDKRIRVVHKVNGGLSDARNAGLKVSTGDYIGFVDSDDWIAPEMYMKLVECMKKNDCDIAACAVKMIWDTKSILFAPKVNMIMDNLDAERALLEEKVLRHPVWYKLYRRKIIEGVNFEVGRYHEDVFWSYLVFAKANKVGIIDYEGYFYSQREDSIMGSNYSIKRLDSMDAYCKRYDYFVVHYPELAREALCAIWENAIYHGQMSYNYLTGDERKNAFDKLDKICKSYPIRFIDYNKKKLTHIMWIALAKYFFSFTVRVKSFLKIGM